MTRNTIHIFGASGSGSTTLANAVATATSLRHVDVDDYYWLPTDPPFQLKRQPDDRLRLISADLDASSNGWLLSGSLCGWGDPLIARFRLVVFLTLTSEIRLERLRYREAARYGPSRLSAGGDLEAHHREFMAWASEYDAGGLDVRSRLRHESWLSQVPCPVLRLDTHESLERLCAAVLEAAA